ncbi:Type II secretion system protein E [Caulifigura coniformis]|uniref:Type II secretion system protein E n=1 Tax=Caulifigura coniformis TaxID=2527983 RepID=A0A517SMC4_9PLAN|nr:ATPase, T2SS/T4P/T4SS family [Caulifigura coniformis]QDT57265.1 Type II secretion system protein E [Caulifigura coniformis]
MAALSQSGASSKGAVIATSDADSLGNGVWSLPLPDQASRFGLEYRPSLGDLSPSAIFVEKIPIAFARRQGVMGFAWPVERDAPAAGGQAAVGASERILVALADLRNWRILDTVGRFLGRATKPLLAPVEVIKASINAAYEQQTGRTETVLATIEGDSLLDELRSLPPRDDLLDVQDRAPVVRLVNSVLFDAVTGLASDVHVQPYEDRVMIRVRIDGVLHDVHTVPKHLQDEIISRVKVVGGMNIAERRLPQDGRASVQVGDRLIDLRIASLPTRDGERVVIRLLDKSARLYTLEELGLGEQSVKQLRRLIHLEHGMLLVTGPTGSGKSTTLYAMLREINYKDRNVLTLEDPIEYQLDGISQTQVNIKKGLTFAAGLRSVLRQDPDVIMVGEIRDKETAVMAVQSALTGHLVYSTLHTNDAASAVARLLDLGIEPYLAASSLVAVLAQRLVRRNCDNCLEFYVPSDYELRQPRVTQSRESFRKGRGCVTCRQTGYRGRFGISELLVVNDVIRQQIQDRANASQILAAARTAGMKRLYEDGIDKAAKGLTTLSEVERIAAADLAPE